MTKVFRSISAIILAVVLLIQGAAAADWTEALTDIEDSQGMLLDTGESVAYTLQQASNAFTLGDTINDSIVTGGDKNSYKFALSESGRVTLDITSYMQYYTLELYDKDGSRIWYSDDNVWNSATGMRNDIHKIDLEAGAYQLRVGSARYTSYSGGATGTYTFKTSFTASGSNETEPNNSISTADVVSMGDTIEGQIAKTASQDYDYYQFTISMSGQTTLDITSYMQYYTLEFYDRDGSRIWYSENNAWNSATGMRNDVHKIDLEAGMYWLRVGSARYTSYTSNVTGTYTIKTSFTASGANETEPNDSIETANMIPSGNVIRGQISKTAGQDYDYYQFTVSVSGQTALDVTSYMQYYTLELYDGDGSRIWYSENNAWNSATGMRNDIHKIDLEAGVYWLRVGSARYTSYTSNVTGTYTIKASFTSSGANETEPNDSIETANMITDGNVIRGQISRTADQDYDYYQFALSTQGNITLDITSYMQYYTLELYNRDGSRIWYSENNAWNSATGMRNDIHKIDLEIGTYWLRIGSARYTNYSSDVTGTYTIRVDGIDNAVQPNPDPEYRINSIVIRNSSGTALADIPKGSFLASVSITNVSSTDSSMVFLAAYSETGEYNGLMYVMVKDMQPDSTIEVTLPVDNTSGSISRLKAFVVSSFADLRPLGSAVSFPA